MGNFLRNIFLLIGLTLTTQVSAYNPFWQKIDKKLIQELLKVNFSNTDSVEAFFNDEQSSESITSNEYLGFGWSKNSRIKYGGYISISASFFYFSDSLVSFVIYPELPAERRLEKKYETWYGEKFKRSNDHLQPYSHNILEMSKPLEYYSGALTFDSLSTHAQYFMQTTSPTLYQDNRSKFFAVCNKLTLKEIEMIMYSKNYASRFSAIEYYLRFKENFSDHDQIDAWAEKCFKQKPQIRILRGCIMIIDDSKELVSEFANRTE